jgi:hypothetical protein
LIDWNGNSGQNLEINFRHLVSFVNISQGITIFNHTFGSVTL